MFTKIMVYDVRCPPHPSSRNDRVQLFDASTRKFMTVVGRRGQIKPGRMQGPEGVAFVDGRREVGYNRFMWCCNRYGKS